MPTGNLAAVIAVLLAIAHPVAADEGDRTTQNGVAAVEGAGAKANSATEDHTVRTYTVTPTQIEPKVGPRIIEPLPPEGQKTGATSGANSK